MDLRGIPVCIHHLKWFILFSYFIIGIFAKFLPLAHQYDSRIVLINRRDYPGSTDYDEVDRQLLASTVDHTPEAAANISKYMQLRAREFYDYLANFVRTENISTKSIVISGWSFGTVWIMALLAYASTYPDADAKLYNYIHRVVAHGRLYSICY